tara:strand:- start:318 stop:464 length:147 start_codon:yes stop_codon:yes gene_type:complete
MDIISIVYVKNKSREINRLILLRFMAVIVLIKGEMELQRTNKIYHLFL